MKSARQRQTDDAQRPKFLGRVVYGSTCATTDEKNRRCDAVLIRAPPSVRVAEQRGDGELIDEVSTES
jgi:hypothetical protein